MSIDNRITGKTRLMGVIGNPIEHSISPQLHNTISTMLELDYAYVPFRVETGNLEEAVRGLKALNLVGFNVTVPYKSEVLKYLNDVTEEVRLIGAANTVKNSEGVLYGYNTDAEGFAKSFKEESGIGFRDKRISVLGAGGAARAICVKIASEGAVQVSIVNRTLSKALEIADIINNNIADIVECYSSDSCAVAEIIRDSDIIINTTSLGMFPQIDRCPIGEDIIFRKEQVVYDVIYNPIKTKLLLKAEKSGCKAINGMGMLFYQGIYAYEIWTELKLNEGLVKEAFNTFSSILIK